MVFLYDVARDSCKRHTFYAKFCLPFVHDSVYDINLTSFSPDGIFLSFARSDNTVSVYDTRFLPSRGIDSKQPDPWAQFTHPQNDTALGYGYGITGMKWISSIDNRKRLGIITGGADGNYFRSLYVKLC